MRIDFARVPLILEDEFAVARLPYRRCAEIAAMLLGSTLGEKRIVDRPVDLPADLRLSMAGLGGEEEGHGY